LRFHSIGLADCPLVIRPIELAGGTVGQISINIAAVNIPAVELTGAVDLTSTADCLVIASVAVYKRVAA